MEKCDILIRNCQILKPDMSVSEACSVVIDHTMIKKIGDVTEMDQQFIPSEVLDGTGKLLMPGFTDGHTHTCQQLLRGRVSDEYPMVWTRFLVPFESNLKPEDSYVSAQLACVEMIKNGTTSFADSGGVHMERVADAVIESGMRAAIAKSTMDMGNAITGAMKETADEAIEHTKELYRAYQGAGDGRIDIWFAIRQVMTCSKELIRMVGEAAAEFKTGIHAHLCEHKDEVSFCLQNYQKRPAQFLDEMGILGPNLLTAHNVMLSDRDISIMAERGVKVIHCPRANLANHGFPKTPQILEAGLSVGLGCDGAAPSNLDLFDEMKVLRYGMLAYWGLASFNPVVMTCPTLLAMATQGGANAIGHGDMLGSVEEGKKADVILLNIDQPHITPTQNLVNSIVDAANGHDVTDSVINGKIVMKDREVLTMDEEKIRREAQIHMDEIVKRAY
ncbi:amidohydrolase family protein [Clostridium sp. MCC353]|uniref:amidohydrolase family protein n=1 Tax=Clostridium sp. MCC353 TaxID=2592646 RepID=UPI001C035AE1|nr:amidohydrolase [Clostridium sp. MCC353]MBT9778029.1 amidohydrolase family protein [Clostridium sp. MCC353]